MNRTAFTISLFVSLITSSMVLGLLVLYVAPLYYTPYFIPPLSFAAYIEVLYGYALADLFLPLYLSCVAITYYMISDP